MRTDKNGHAWKRQNGSARAVCPFCGVESKVAACGPKGGRRDVFRKIGYGGDWMTTMPMCEATLRVGRSIRYRFPRLVTIVRVMHAWPPRFECRDADGRQRIVPVIAYWRVRRKL